MTNNFRYISTLNLQTRVKCLDSISHLIYRPMHRTDLFIVNGADLEYTKNIMVNEAVLGYIYQKEQKLKSEF